MKWLGAVAAILAIVAALAIGMWRLAPAPGPAPAPPLLASKPPGRLLVLYQDDPTGPGSEFAALMTANLLGRFGVAKIADLDGYKASDADGVQALFVLPAFGGARPPQALLDQIRSGRTPVVWIQHGARWLAETPAEAAAMGWRPGAPAPREYVQVRYKGQTFLRDPRDRSAVAEPEVLDPSRVTVFATVAGRDGRQVPWALRSGALTYVAEAPYAYTSEDDRYVVFADLLFRTLAPDTPARHRAMVRIEDRTASPASSITGIRIRSACAGRCAA